MIFDEALATPLSFIFIPHPEGGRVPVHADCLIDVVQDQLPYTLQDVRRIVPNKHLHQCRTLHHPGACMASQNRCASY